MQIVIECSGRLGGVAIDREARYFALPHFVPLAIKIQWIR